MELTFLKKPSTEKITAVKWTGLNKEEITDFCDEAALVKIESQIGEYFGYSIPTFTGNVVAKPGDFIVKLNKHNKEFFEVWSEEKLNESYFNTDDVNRAYLDIEKSTIAEKLNRLNAYITDPSKKAPYKKLDSIEQGFLLSEKEILESYLRTLFTYATYKYGDENSEITVHNKSKIEQTLNLDSGNRFTIKISGQPGKCSAEFFIHTADTKLSLAKATRYDATIRNLISDLGDYFGLEDNWYIFFGIAENYLDAEIQDIEDTDIREFSYMHQVPSDPDPATDPDPDNQGD